MTEVTFDSLCANFEDISTEQLHGEISDALGIRYLGPATIDKPVKRAVGYIAGANLHPIISLHVQITPSILTLTGTSHPINVHFLYLAASPQTYMSREALKAMGIEDMVVVGEPMDDPEVTRLPLLINGYLILVLVSPSKSHFSHLNVLGNDFIRASGTTTFFGGLPLRFEITFP